MHLFHIYQDPLIAAEETVTGIHVSIEPILYDSIVLWSPAVSHSEAEHILGS